jgi:hypothetical protein
VTDGELLGKEGQTFTRNVVWRETLTNTIDPPPAPLAPQQISVPPTATDVPAAKDNGLQVKQVACPAPMLPQAAAVDNAAPKLITPVVNAPKKNARQSKRLTYPAPMPSQTVAVGATVRKQATTSATTNGKKVATRNVVGGVMPSAPNVQQIGPVLWQCDESTLSRAQLRAKLHDLITVETSGAMRHERLIIIQTTHQSKAPFQHCFIEDMLERDQFLEFFGVDNLARMLARRHGVTTYDHALPQLLRQLVETKAGAGHFTEAVAEVIIKNLAIQLMMYTKATVVVHTGDENYGHFVVINFDNTARQVVVWDSCGTRLGMATAANIA